MLKVFDYSINIYIELFTGLCIYYPFRDVYDFFGALYDVHTHQQNCGTMEYPDGFAAIATLILLVYLVSMAYNMYTYLRQPYVNTCPEATTCQA